ncbi:MAG: glycosyltransferase [Chitinophagaceae bacterium]
MRILFVADTYYPHINGVYYFMQRLAERLQAAGHTVAVLAPSDELLYTNKVVEGIRVFGMPSFPLLMYKTIRIPVPLALHARIDMVYTAFNPDILHLQNHFTINKAALAVNKKHGIPVIGTNHFMTENFTPFYHFLRMDSKIEKIMWAAFSKVFNQMDLVTTPTETGAELIRPKLHVKVVAVSNGIDLVRFNKTGGYTNIRKKYGIPDMPILLFVGRLDPEKNIGEVLEAVARLADKDFCFVIAGKGTIRPALEKQVEKLGLAGKVVFTGFVSNDDLPQLYHISRCYVTASVAELQSIATMEAMACGLPVIAANAGALPELVHNTENGFLFNPGDLNTLSKSIVAIFEDHQWRKMRQCSLDIIAPHDINNTVRAYEKWHANCIAKKNHSSLVKIGTIATEFKQLAMS